MCVCGCVCVCVCVGVWECVGGVYVCVGVWVCMSVCGGGGCRCVSVGVR